MCVQSRQDHILWLARKQFGQVSSFGQNRETTRTLQVSRCHILAPVCPLPSERVFLTFSACISWLALAFFDRPSRQCEDSHFLFVCQSEYVSSTMLVKVWTTEVITVTIMSGKCFSVSWVCVIVNSKPINRYHYCYISLRVPCKSVIITNCHKVVLIWPWQTQFFCSLQCHNFGVQYF